jgi:hypothetical protein
MNNIVKHVRLLAFALQMLVFPATAAGAADSPYMAATDATATILADVNQKNDLATALDQAKVLRAAAAKFPDGSLADMVTQLASAIEDAIYEPGPLLLLKGRSEAGRKAVARVRFKLHRIVDHCQAFDAGVTGDPFNESLQVVYQIMGAIDSERELPIVRPLGNLLGQITIENIDRPGMDKLGRLVMTAIEELAKYETEVSTVAIKEVVEHLASNGRVLA